MIPELFGDRIDLGGLGHVDLLAEESEEGSKPTPPKVAKALSFDRLQLAAAWHQADLADSIKDMSALSETTGGALVRPARQRKQLPKPPRVIGRMKSLPHFIKGEGTCKQGERADLTGCTPTSGEGGKLKAEEIKPGTTVELPETDDLVGGKFVVESIGADGTVYGRSADDPNEAPYSIGKIGDFYKPGESPEYKPTPKESTSKEEPKAEEPPKESIWDILERLPPPSNPKPISREPVDSSHIKSIQDLKKAASALGVSVTTSGKMRPGQEASSAKVYEFLTTMKNSGWEVPKNVTVDYNLKARAGQFNPADDSVRLYSHSILFPGQEDSEVKGWNSVPRWKEPASTLVHECGHRDHYQKLKAALGDEKAMKLFSVWSKKDGLVNIRGENISKATFKRVAKEVSDYGASNPLEFIAEYQTGRRYGKTYSDQVNKMYELFGGP